MLRQLKDVDIIDVWRDVTQKINNSKLNSHDEIECTIIETDFTIENYCQS